MKSEATFSFPVYMWSPRCGYCGGKKTDYGALKSSDAQKAITAPPVTAPGHASVGMMTEGMTCEIYDRLINMGYRRSGDYLYKNDPLRSCCRMYTIRTNLGYLKMHKNHRKTLNRFVNTISGSEETTKRGNGPLPLLWLTEQEQSHLDTFYTVFEEADLTEAKYQLYKKYQIHVHNDEPSEVSEEQFERFLCTKPFTDVSAKSSREQKSQFEYLNTWVRNYDPETGKTPNPNNIKPLGAIHECYYLNDKLIAISVLDFLPSGISSVYFIWDPDYAHLSLGTLSGLRDVFLCSALNLGYYYLGYYIADCVKMKYKLKFGGELLDVTNQTFFPLELIDKYVSDGKFFCLQENDSPDVITPVLDYGDLPVTYGESKFDGKELKEISCQIFGNPETYKDAKKTETETLGLLKIEHRDKNLRQTLRDIPLIAPGFGSMDAIHYYATNEVFPDIFTTLRMGKKYYELLFEDLEDEGKRMLINAIRAFGLEILQRATMTVY